MEVHFQPKLSKVDQIDGHCRSSIIRQLPSTADSNSVKTMESYSAALVFVFNLFAVTNIKYDGNQFLVPRFVTFKNVLVLIVLLLSLNYSVPNSYSDVTQTKVGYNQAALSVLYISVFSITTIQYRMITLVLVFVQIRQRHKVAQLLNRFKDYAQEYVAKQKLLRFERHSIRLVLFSVALLLFCYAVEFAAFFSLNLHGLTRSAWFHIHGAIIYLFTLFVSLILEFILCLLDDLLEKIKNISKSSARKFVGKVLLQFEIIHEFLAAIDTIFGPVLTIILFFTMIILISKVTGIFHVHSINKLSSTELQHCFVIRTRFENHFCYQNCKLSHVYADCVCFDDFFSETMPTN